VQKRAAVFLEYIEDLPDDFRDRNLDRGAQMLERLALHGEHRLGARILINGDHGRTSGIGLATAKAFLREGARVVVVGRDQKNVDQAKDLLGVAVVAVHADVTKLGELDAHVRASGTSSSASTCSSPTPVSLERRFRREDD
jgi:shikimate 5-dehydrogenase